MNMYFCAGDEQFLHGGCTHFALVMNTLVLEMNQLITSFQTSASPTHSYISSYQRLSKRTFLEVNTHRYSPLKKGSGYHALVLTFRVRYTHKLYIQLHFLLD